jgi:ATP-binding cassette, subfamily B, bacterial PglK
MQVLFKKLWHHLSNSRKKQFYFLLALMIVTSLMEVISISAVLPFLGTLTNPDIIYHHPAMHLIIQMLGITSPEQLLLPITIIFIVAAVLAGLVRLLLLYVITKLSFATGADLSINIYRRTLYQKYEVHISRNSSEVINGIISKTGTVISGIINPILTLMSSFIFMIITIYVLFIIDALVAFSAISGFVFIYFLITQLSRKKLKENSMCVAKQSTNMIKALQEGLGGIRDVLINRSQNFYCQLYRDSDTPLRQAMASNVFINGSPRYLIESIGMVLVAILAYSMTLRGGDMSSVIPVLGALALGAQRLLPTLQQSYSAYSTIIASYYSFKDVIELLEQPILIGINNSDSDAMHFNREIKLKNLNFYYEGKSEQILNNVNLKILKGSRVGFIGATGSGKSTLLDVVMGLLLPTNGSIKVDGCIVNNSNRSLWQEHIAHVPQNIYLSDGTIEANIAFGISKNDIDHNQVQKAAKQAQLSNLVESWEDGYKTIVGEQGVRLSGGQRQRIGIARALYKKSDVLVFDEATSALDIDTEKSVMREIQLLDRDITILIIAHRLSTLEGCDQIVKLEDKGVKVMRPDDLFK